MTTPTPAPAGVSVVIPVYQAEHFVAQALDAVLSQTRLPSEVVLVDDGSTDGSRVVIDTYIAGLDQRQPAVRVVSQPNRGPAAARNAGVRASTQPLVAFHDADDRAVPTWLEVMGARLDAEPDIVCVLGRQVVEVEPGAPLPTWLTGAAPTGAFGSETPTRYAHMCSLMRRAALDVVGLFDETLPAGEDTDLILRFIDAGLRVEFTEDVVLRRRVHGNNLTQDDDLFRRAQFRVLARRILRKQAQQ